ncbi:MAG TPA: multi antimicrobial extrusion protein MatE, partial [Micromonosporaceae bacterium]|nr:multi antimicrobial extrusion protein MatE [Micromonosporaceae bacterium]
MTVTATRAAETGAGPFDHRRTVAANLAGAALAGVAGVGVTWLVARGLGQAPAGAFFAATAAFTLVGTVAKLGTPTGLVYWLARLRAQSDVRLIRPC